MTMFNAKVFWKFEIFELSENLRKLCVSTKFQYRKIKWNFGIVCNSNDWNTYLKFILDLLIIFYGYFKVIIVSHLNLSNLGLSSTQVRILVQVSSMSPATNKGNNLISSLIIITTMIVFIIYPLTTLCSPTQKQTAFPLSSFDLFTISQTLIKIFWSMRYFNFEPAFNMYFWTSFIYFKIYLNQLSGQDLLRIANSSDNSKVWVANLLDVM